MDAEGVKRGMTEFGRRWLNDTWGVSASAVFTVVVFTGLPILHFLQPQSMPLAEAVYSMERPVYYEMDSLLTLQTSDQPAAVDDDEVTEGVADDSVEEVAETESEEVVASNNQGQTGEGEGESEEGAREVAAGEKIPRAPYRVSITRVVAGPRVSFALTDKQQGASEEQKREFLAAMKAGSGVRARSKGKRARCRKADPDVFPQEDGSFEVNRSMVEHYTSSLKNFNSLGWSGPYKEDGERGWKIGGFGCNSPLHFAGLRRGDIVKTVNGRKTNTWLQVFGAYRKLKHHDDFVVAIIRKGEPVELKYRLI